MQAVKPVGGVGPANASLLVYECKECMSFTATKVTQESHKA